MATGEGGAPSIAEAAAPRGRAPAFLRLGPALERLAEASKPFGTTITVNGDTAVWKIAAP